MEKKYTLQDELLNSINYFLDHSNFEENSKGFGLSLDQTDSKNICSIAASGFMLIALVLAAKYKIKDTENCRNLVIKSLESIYDNVPNFSGFLVHFADFKTAKRLWHCEYSTIDTALFLAGAIVADSYFEDKKISSLVDKFLNRIDWERFVTIYHGRYVIRMAYNDYNYETKSLRDNIEDGFIYQWHMYAEQLFMYYIMSGNESIPEELARKIYNGFRKDNKRIEDKSYIRCPTGSLFTYQFSGCFFDYEKYEDEDGTNYFENTKKACYDNYYFCKNNKDYLTFKNGLWGISASDGPHGYKGYGIPPYDYDHNIIYTADYVDGTIAIYSLINSIPYIGNKALDTLSLINEKYDYMIGKYGYYDSMNLDLKWHSHRYYGIDKGSAMVSIENLNSNLIHDLFTNHRIIQKGIQKLKIRRKHVDT